MSETQLKYMITRSRSWWELRKSCTWSIPRVQTWGLIWSYPSNEKNPISITPSLALSSPVWGVQLRCRIPVLILHSTFEPHVKCDVVSKSIAIGNKVLKDAQYGLVTDVHPEKNLLSFGSPAIENVKPTNLTLL